ncbi:MAG: type III pantothenate kinase [Rhodanobacter sp.]
MRLLLDLGNSRLKWACATAPAAAWDASGSVDWSCDVSVRLQQAWADLMPPQDIVGASVVDGAREAQVAAACVARFGLAPRWLRTPLAACGVRNGYEQPQRLGVDRFLAMVAARAAGRAPCVVASAGTALTLDALAADGQHLGGWIVPGVHAMRQALADNTARVVVECTGSVTDLARNTEDAVASGCWHALAAAIERFAARAQPRLGATPTLLLGGGDAPALLPWLNVPAQLMADSVLRGLAHWAHWAQDATLTPDAQADASVGRA